MPRLTEQEQQEIIGFIEAGKPLPEQYRFVLFDEKPEAEERFRLITESIYDCVSLVDTSGVYQYVSPSYRKTLGYAPEELIGGNGFSITHPDDIERVFKLYIERMEKGYNEIKYETRLLHRDGHYVPMEVTALAIKDPQGKLTGGVLVARDITERKQAEASLQRQLRYEQAIALASTCLLNHEETPYKVLHGAIACLREATDTSRVYIFENSDDPAAGLCASLTHEACAPGVPPEIDNPLLQQMPYSPGMARWRELLSNKKPVWGCVCDFPESERAHLEPQGIISIMVLPLFRGGRWHGFVGFDETLTPRKWQAADVALLKTAADMIGIFMAHMRIQEALRESRERYYGVYETAPIAFVLWDRACHITDWNRHAEKTFGWSREEALGRNFFDLIIPESAHTSVEDIVTRLLEGLMPSRSINENITKDGSIILCEWNNTIQYDSRGEVVGVLSLALDITERRRAEEERQQFTATLEARVQDYTRELKTANASLQKTTIQLRDLAREMIQVEEREQKRLATVLHDDLQQLLVASKMKMHRLVADANPPQSKVEILELIDKSIAVSRSLVMDLSPPVLWERDLMISLQWLARWMLEHHGLTVEISGPEEYEVSDSLNVLIFQAVRELLFNIVKHAGVDRAFVKVDHFAADLLRIIVNDQGRGFPPDASENFGLFRVRERLGYIGGTIQVASKSAHGTQVIFTIPLKPTVVAEAVSVVSNNVIEPSTAKDIRQVTYQLLVVDDHAVLRQGLVELLDKEDDITVIGVAADGHQAIEKTRLLHPDIVLMDISMPGMSGIEATRIIMEEMPETCIVGLSMHDQAEMKKAMHEAGAKAYVCKGEPIEDLMATIRSMRPKWGHI
ncbi:MAG: PAS domain S-box protein [Desulfobacteraceae bacterium]|jgi:PAS domain S-box-containing protein|nr:MAG: PAS domain S-box protein [Desulfobacteraceae bacterium]